MFGYKIKYLSHVSDSKRGGCGFDSHFENELFSFHCCGNKIKCCVVFHCSKVLDSAYCKFYLVKRSSNIINKSV